MDSESPVIPSRLLEDVRAILQRARHKTFATVNTIMVDAYWNIGQRIVQEEQGGNARAEYGSQLIRNLARQLGDEFGSGVSVANLKNFRQFYLAFPDAGKSYALRSLLTWTHWRLVMRVEDDGEAFEEKMPCLVAELKSRFAEFAKLEQATKAKLKGLDYGG